MPPQILSTSNTTIALQSFSKKASIAVTFIGCTVMLGWIFDIAFLKSFLPGLVTMKANASLCFIVGGLSLWLVHLEAKNLTLRRTAQACSLAVFLIGFLTIIQYLFNINIGIDRLLFQESVSAVKTSIPGRMAPNTAMNFLLLGSALLLLNKRRPNYLPAQLFSLAALLIAFLGFLGYAYGNAYFYQFGSGLTAMALHTSIAFLLLCLGILFVQPDSGIMAPIAKDNAGGIMARRLYPLVIVIPSGLGALILSGFRDRIYTEELAISLSSLLNIIVFGVLIWWNANSLGIIDRQRQLAEIGLKQANTELEYKASEQQRIATFLASSVNEVTTTMDELAASSAATAEQAVAVAEQARHAQNLSANGTVALQQTHLGMTALEEKVGAIASQIEETQKLTSQIGDISRMVSDFASQTNMLALNAAIEAVRAQEHGKGFAVVAHEIRKLADQSKKSADNINTLVSEIKKAIKATVSVTDEGIITVQSGVKVAQETAENFQGVAQSINQIFVLNQQIALTVKQQDLAIQQVVSTMNTINAKANS
ncbi:MAG TPA: methyl-accepting chemotaxis protein [Kamptonema sp.]|nr:methyl-accepting chemotaxis protein [Kamptonema sp.]